MSEATATPLAQQGPKRRSAAADFFIRLLREKPLGVFGALIVLILLIAGIFADVLAPYPMQEIHLGDRLASPSGQYLLGTDHLGRDLLSRVIFGARVSLIVGLAGTSLATVVSAIIGIVTGFVGGKLDMLVQRFVDAWMCFPGLLLLLIIIAQTGPGMMQVIIVVGLTTGIGGSRIVRGAVIGIKGNMYVDAASAVGCSLPRTLIRHIFPNVLAPLIVLFSTRIASVIMAEAGLSFLGFGIPPPTPSWGGMLTGAGREYMLLAPGMAFWPGLALTVVVYGVNMFGDAARDLMDPRLRGGLGRYGTTKQKKERKARAAASAPADANV